MSRSVEVSALPSCDFHLEQGVVMPARYDGVTKQGRWAYMCGAHYALHGIGLGTGKGQKLVVKP